MGKENLGYRRIGVVLLSALLWLGGAALTGGAGFAGEVGENGGTLLSRPPEDSSYQLISGAVLSATTKLDLWHYSGNYWMVTNPGQNPIKIMDKDIQGSISQVIPAERATFRLALPQAVKARIQKGDLVVPVIRSGSAAKLDQLFSSEDRQFQINGDSLVFSAKPKFNLIPQNQLNFRTYGLDIPVKVPFIQREYGYNMYSVFGNGYRAVQVNGWVDPNDKTSMSGMPKGWIHPSMIADGAGTIKPGYQLMINSQLKPSGGFAVGEGTFSNAGALGLCFEYPVEFTFYASSQEPEEPKPEEPEKPPVPEKIVCGSCGLCPLEQKGVCSEKSCQRFGRPECGCYDPPVVEGEALLSLPPYTYEMHPVSAQDKSRITVNGKTYSAARAYEEGFADNTFRIAQSGTGGTISRVPGSRTQAEVAFPRMGNYDVLLKINTADGQTLQDQKPIEVRKTPGVEAFLSGTQKQNRKQVLTVRVAQNPASPVRELYVELMHKESGEKVRLYHHTDGTKNSLVNSELIRTRPIEETGGDQYWLSCKLEFLTKNTVATDFSYRVYARDSRGQWDEKEGEFPVSADKPPQANISMEPVFLRQGGSDTALIHGEDATMTDGDQVQRTWSANLTPVPAGEETEAEEDAEAEEVAGTGAFTPLEQIAGYEDTSFGSKKSVAFQKTGVGKLTLRLEVKEIWTEETLPEYISEADYLTGAAVAESEVVNVAPVVSLKPMQAKTADVLLLGASEAECEELKKTAAELYPLLLEKAVDADIRVERLTPSPDNNITYRVIGEATAPYGFQGSRSGFWENASWAVDNQRLYKGEASWLPGEDGQLYPQLPYVIRAYDIGGSGLTERWNLTVTDKMVSSTNRGANAFFSQDNDNKYLFFSIGGKTLTIAKDTGALLTTLGAEVGRHSSARGSAIYTYKSDGIYKISASDGSFKRIRELRLASTEVRRIGGKDHFLVTNGIQIFRGTFDPVSEYVSLERLPGTGQDNGRTVYRLAGIDTEGKLIVSCVAPGGDFQALTIRVYSKDNRLLKEAEASIEDPESDYVVPVYNSGGICNYVGLTTAGKGSREYHVTTHLWGVENGYYSGARASDRSGYPTEEGRILMGIEHGNGNCYILTGAEYTYIAGEGYNSSNQGMPQRAKAFCFPVPSGDGEVASNLGSGVWYGIQDTVEYAAGSDAYMALSTGDNNENGGAVHRTQILRWNQSAEDVLLRSINRNFSGTKDLSFAVLLDGSGAFGNADTQGITAGLWEKNAQCIVGESDAERLAELIKPESMGTADAMALQTEGASGKAEKRMQLDPGTVYYYEYDYQGQGEGRDILRFTAEYDRPVPQSQLLPEKYVVTDSFEEDFNDSDTNPYFTIDSRKIRNGVYNAAERIDDAGNARNLWRSDSGSATFTIPEGSNGVLSFDYDINMENPQDWMMQFSVDGVPWKNFVEWGGQGHYTHPELLEPGVHTLSASCGQYESGQLSVWSRLDNLRVYWVEKDGAESPSDAIETQSQVAAKGSWNHVSGSFRTPSGAASFQRAPGEYYSGPVDTVPYTWWISEEPGQKEIRISLPKNIPYLAIQTASIPRNSGKNSQYPVKYMWNNYMWTCYASNRYAEDVASNIPQDYEIVLKNIGGTLSMKQASSTYRGAQGDFAGITMMIPNKGNSLISGNRYFMAKTKDGDTGLFLENDHCSGGTILSVEPGAAGLTQMKNLRIYTIEKGIKVYMDKGDFANSGGVGGWKTTDAKMAPIKVSQNMEEEEKLVYKKGELVSYLVNYNDYEKDPSKKQYWRYTHTPFNDGPNLQAALILDEAGQVVSMSGIVLHQSIPRFYIDGKYTVEHWQEDNTTRGKNPMGNPQYDKASNVASLTFYIEGAGAAPWITGIRTVPSPVKDGGEYRIQVGVDDTEKDPLRLTTEVYREGKLIYTHRKEGIAADPITGKYPAVTTEVLPEKARTGRYQVVCTVRDYSGAGVGKYSFSVVSAGNVRGEVYHTDQWEQNRKKYNVERFGAEFSQSMSLASYTGQVLPRKRGTNVFWPGETFCLRAGILGDPLRVTCQIKGEGYSTVLRNTGRKNSAGERIYEGTLWESAMLHRWGRRAPEQLVFRFTAEFSDGEELQYDVPVIVDDSEEYWRLHRYS